MAGDSAGGREVGRISIKVVPNLDGFYREVKDRLEEIEHELKAKIKVVPDMDEFREKVDAATRDLKDAKVKVKTDIDRNGDLIKDLDEVGKNAHVKVKADLDKSSLARTIGEAKLAAKAADVTIKVKTEHRGGFLGGAANLLSNFKMPDIMPNFGGLGGAASVFLLVGALSLLAPALAMVSQAIVGLPALVSGLVLPIGVFALGLGGIKKALDASGILDLVQGKTNKKGVKTGKDKQSLGAALKETQQQISDVFEKGFTPLFKQVGAVIPQLLRGLPFVAQGIVNATKGVVDALTNPALIAGFDRFTNSVGTMLTNLGPGLGSFATGMSNLIVNVGDHLPGLGNQMTAWADRFTSWVTKISKPKQNWFGTGDIPNSSILDSAITNMKPILNSVIDFVGKLTDAGLKLAANPQMGDNIKNVVDGLGNFVLQVLPGLERFFGQVAHYMGNIKPPEVGPNGKPLPPDPNRPPPVDFDRVHSPSSKGFDHTWFGPSDGNLIPKAFRPDGLGGDLKAMRDWFTSHLKGFADNGGLGIGGALISSIFGGGAGPGGKANAAPEPFNPGKAVGQPPPPQQPQQPPQPVQSPKVDMNGITQSIQGGAGAIAAAANEAFKALVDAATVAVSQSVAAVQQLPGAVAQALSGLFAAGQAAGQALGTGMAAGIAASAPSAIAAAHALAQGVTAAAHTTLEINSPSKVFHRIGMGVGEGFQNGMEASFQDVFGSAEDHTGRLGEVTGAALRKHPTPGGEFGAYGPRLRRHTGDRIGVPFQDPSDNIDNGGLIPDLDAGGVQMPSIQAAFKTHGAQAAQGFANGLGSGAGLVNKAALGIADNATGTVKGALGIHSPSVVFHGLGQNTAEGFQTGLEGGFQGVLDSAKGLAKQVTDAIASGTAGPQLAQQVKEQIQAIDIEKQKLKVDSDSTSDKGQKQAIKGQIDQLNIAKSQLGLSKDQLKTGGDSTKAKMDELSIQEQQLKAEYDATSDKGKRKDLKAQMDALKVQKDQLKLYQMQHPESKDKDKKSDDMGQQLAGVLNKSVDIGKNFAMANVKQFENDLGISGNGALPQLADMGLNWMQSMLGGLVSGAMGGNGKDTHIHVNSVEEAFAAKQNQDNKHAHQYAGR